MPPTLHPQALKTLSSLQDNPPQSLLLSGYYGVGLLTIATWFAGSSLAGVIRPQDSKEHVDSESGIISVEMIRRLYDQTRAKHTTRQLIIIDDADRMSHGAQSAFLKLLEEPGSHIYFLLTSHTPQNLLPTIRSRVQHVIIQQLSLEQSTNYIDSLGITDATRRAQLQFIAEGLPAELSRLTSDEAYFKEKAEIIGDARDFLKANTYKKMLLIQKYKANRLVALQFIDSTIHILRRSISAKPQQSLINQLDHLLETRELIAANHNVALQMAHFVL